MSPRKSRKQVAADLNAVIQSTVELPVGSLRENGTSVLDLPPDFDRDDVARIQAEATERDPSGGHLLASNFISSALGIPAELLQSGSDLNATQARHYDPSVDGSDMIGDDTPIEEMPELVAARKKEEWKSKLRGAWTDEKRQALREKLQAKYASGEIVHPMKGKTLSEETKGRIATALKGRTPLTTCSVCGRPLSDPASAAAGKGSICAGKHMGVTVGGTKLHEMEE